MEAKKELVVPAIENGTVIDHIPTDVRVAKAKEQPLAVASRVVQMAPREPRVARVKATEAGIALADAVCEAHCLYQAMKAARTAM